MGAWRRMSQTAYHEEELKLRENQSAENMKSLERQKEYMQDMAMTSRRIHKRQAAEG